MMSRWQFILLLVGGACTAAAFLKTFAEDTPLRRD